MTYTATIATFTPPPRMRLDAVRTPCENPACAHIVTYGRSTCCPEFMEALRKGLAEGAPEHVPGQVMDRLFAPYFHWSGGTVRVPAHTVSRVTASGWYNGVHYADSKPVFVRALAGWEPVYVPAESAA